MERFKQSGLWLMVLALCTACEMQIQGVDIGRIFDSGKQVGQLWEKDVEEERRIGKETAGILLSRAELNDNDELQRYVNKVGYWLSQHAGRAELDWRFMVVESSAINAYAGPGGYIFITRGMVESLNSEAELAAVLAHEIAHVINKHHLQALKKKARTGLATNLAVLATQFSQASKQGKDDKVEVGGALDTVVNDLYFRGLDRDDELDADNLGLRILARAGYDPYALVSVLQLIHSREGSGDADMLRFIKLHPSAELRLQAIEPSLEQLDAVDLGYRVLDGRFRKYLR